MAPTLVGWHHLQEHLEREREGLMVPLPLPLPPLEFLLTYSKNISSRATCGMANPDGQCAFGCCCLDAKKMAKFARRKAIFPNGNFGSKNKQVDVVRCFSSKLFCCITIFLGQKIKTRGRGFFLKKKGINFAVSSVSSLPPPQKKKQSCV